MAKITLTDVVGGPTTTMAANINSNSNAIELAIENTLSRDGTSPNAMGANLDMNSYKIINLPEATTPSEPVRLGDLAAVLSAAGDITLPMPGASDAYKIVGVDAVGANLRFSSSLVDGADNLTPGTVGGASLGTTTLSWQNLRLNTAGTINFNAGDILITHAANLLTFSASAPSPSFVFNYTSSLNGNSSLPSLIQAHTTSTRPFGGYRWAASTAGAFIDLGKSRGAAPGTHSLVQSGDTLGGISFSGSNGATFDVGARITCEVDGTAGASADMPGRLLFLTTPDASATPVERMRINNAGQIEVVAGPLVPQTTGGSSLGSTSLGWQNFYLNPQSSPTYARGKLVYDSDNECLTFFNNDSNCSLQIGQEQWIRVVNNSGSTISNGKAVYISGASAGLPTIALASNAAGATSDCVGLATEDILNGATGYITSGGRVNGVDTSGFAAGATLYLGNTPGSLTSTIPLAPLFRVKIGSVGTSNASTGTIHVSLGASRLGLGTANQVAGMDSAGTGAEYKTVAGTANEITVTHAANLITWSLPATLTFTGKTVTNGNFNSPTFVTPALGTPASGTLTNCTGFPTANLAGAGAGVLAFLATPSSANLAAAITDETGTAGNLVFSGSPTITTPNITGTTAAGNATAGSIGEVLTANASTVSLTTATAANITSISLTAGDWDVWGNMTWTPAATTNVTIYLAGISTTSATIPAAPSMGRVQDGQAASVPVQPSSRMVGPLRVNVSSTTTCYLVASATFTVSTMTASGIIYARRVR